MISSRTASIQKQLESTPIRKWLEGRMWRETPRDYKDTESKSLMINSATLPKGSSGKNKGSTIWSLLEIPGITLAANLKQSSLDDFNKKFNMTLTREDIYSELGVRTSASIPASALKLLKGQNPKDHLIVDDGAGYKHSTTLGEFAKDNEDEDPELIDEVLELKKGGKLSAGMGFTVTRKDRSPAKKASTEWEERIASLIEGTPRQAGHQKTANYSGKEILIELLGKDFYKALSHARKVDPQSSDMMGEAFMVLSEEFELNSGMSSALNRLKTITSNYSKMSPELLRNTAFKAADSAGVRLPSGMF